MPGLFRPKLDRKSVELQGVPLFSRLSRAELQWLAGQMDEIDEGEGVVLTAQGKPGHTFYILLEGEVDVVVDGGVVATLGPGEFFGEISMLDRGAATATVTTRAPMRMLVMSHAQFRDAVRGNESVLMGVLAAVGERLRANEAAGSTRPS